MSRPSLRRNPSDEPFGPAPRRLATGIGFRATSLGQCWGLAVSLGLALLPGSLRAADEGDSVVVIYNSSMPDSKSVAEHYAQRRQVPSSQVLGLELPQGESMTRQQYLEQLENPLVRTLEEGKLWTFAETKGGEENGKSSRPLRRLTDAKIRYVALCYGVPIKIEKDESLVEKEAEKLDAQLRRTEASVDSQLAALPMFLQQSILWSGPIGNPAYGATNTALLHPTNGVLLVARLDGPTPEIARGLVDKAIEAETNGFWGRAYFDARGITNGGFKLGDDWIRASAALCRNAGIETVLDNEEPTFTTGFPLSSVAIYAGWYDWHASGPFTRPEVDFMPGAIAYHLHSFSADTIRSPHQNWVGPLLARGATATMGCVYEPFLFGTPDLGVFFARILFLRTSFAEAACAAQNVLSWQAIAVGDPLYRPYLKHPFEAHKELESRGSPLDVWFHVQTINRNIVMNYPMDDLVRYIADMPVALRRDPIILEKLADILWEQKKFSDSLYTYEDSLKRTTSSSQKIRLLLRLGHLRSYFGPDAKALGFYERLLKDFPEYPDALMVYKKMLPLARNEGQKELVERCEAQIKRLEAKP